MALDPGNDWDEKELDSGTPDDPPGGLPEGFGKSPYRSAGIALVLLVALGILSYFLFRPAPEAPPAEPVAEDLPAAPEEVPPDEPVEEPLPPLPTLEESDPLLREWIAKMLTHPELAQWLLTEGLARRLVGTVDAVADGVSPAPHLGFLRPEEQFRVKRSRGGIVIDPVSYQRYDPFAEAFGSLDVDATAAAYAHVKPLLEEAYRELGRERSFEDALSKAIDRSLATPQLTGEIRLEEKIKSFAYADPDLESLDDAQKHLLRLGPENLARVQAKLRALREALLP